MIAFCRPGKTLAAAMLLAAHGVPVDEIRETRWLPEGTEIMVIDPEPFWPLPFKYDWAGR
jgi:hypothetical protein